MFVGDIRYFRWCIIETFVGNNTYVSLLSIATSIFVGPGEYRYVDRVTAGTFIGYSSAKVAAREGMAGTRPGLQEGGIGR